MYTCVCVCVCACVRACVSACVRACVCVLSRIKSIQLINPIYNHWISVINKSVNIIHIKSTLFHLSKLHKRLNIDKRIRSFKEFP